MKEEGWDAFFRLDGREFYLWAGAPEGKGELCADTWDLNTFADCRSGHVVVHRGGGLEECGKVVRGRA